MLHLKICARRLPRTFGTTSEMLFDASQTVPIVCRQKIDLQDRAWVLNLFPQIFCAGGARMTSKQV